MQDKHAKINMQDKHAEINIQDKHTKISIEVSFPSNFEDENWLLHFFFIQCQKAHNWRINIIFQFSSFFCTGKKRSFAFTFVSDNPAFTVVQAGKFLVFWAHYYTVNFHLTVTKWPLESTHSRWTLPRTSWGTSTPGTSKSSQRGKDDMLCIGTTFIWKLGQNTHVSNIIYIMNY